MSEAIVAKEVESKSRQSLSAYHCAVCDVHVSSEHSLNAHLRGRHHQVILDKHRAAERSVYVRGFQRGTSHQELVEFFNQFGQVKNVWLPGNYIYAIVEFADAATSERLLRSREALLLKDRRLTLKPRNIKSHHGDEALQGTNSNPRKQKSKVHRSEPPEQLSVFDQAVMAKVSAAKSADEQLHLISTHYKMPMSAIKAQFKICKVLSDELRVHFPECMVVPFGAAISGHGTLTSDCDICLLSQPSLEQRALFSPSSYHPTGLDQTPDEQEGSSLLPPSSPLRDDSLTSSSEASSASASPTQLPRKSATDRKSHTPFDVVASCVRKISHFSKFYTIPQARCPIIRFTYDPFWVHCDLSVDNLLGPANTRLMQAYSKFDNRFSLLVPFVRLWVKYNGPPRNQLNNYTVSLMLIYSLQRCQPPLLPCLQNPGPWPKNMTWYGKLGFSSAPQTNLSVGPWGCGFVPPESLLPSTNTQSPVELLLHFFKFYSDWKGKEVVAIHCPAPKTLSPSEAKELAVHPQKLGYKVRPFRDLMPLIVQDPFEFDHNLCKSLNVANCEMFFGRIKVAASILSEKKMVLPLFDQKEYQLLETKHFSNVKKLTFNSKELESLLQRDQAMVKLAEHVSQLKLTNASVHLSLSRIVLKAVTNYLTSKFSFNCSPGEQPEMKQGEATFDLSESGSGDVGTSMELSAASDDVPAKPEQGELDQSSSSSQLATEKSSKETAEVVMKQERSGDISRRKRAHSSDGEVEGDLVTDETKRTRNQLETLTALDVLHQVQRSCTSDVYVCSAMTDTWTHRRQRQRHQKKGSSESMETSELCDSLPAPLPQLCVRLSTCSEVPLDSLSIKVDQLAPLNMNKFKNWFALINKELRRNN